MQCVQSSAGSPIGLLTGIIRAAGQGDNQNMEIPAAGTLETVRQCRKGGT